MNLQDIILDLIKTDDSFTSTDHNRVLRLYNSSPLETQLTIDTIFVALCGYSMRTIIDDLNLNKG